MPFSSIPFPSICGQAMRQAHPRNNAKTSNTGSGTPSNHNNT
jgi:hypothetical protein